MLACCCSPFFNLEEENALLLLFSFNLFCLNEFFNEQSTIPSDYLFLHSSVSSFQGSLESPFLLYKRSVKRR